MIRNFAILLAFILLPSISYAEDSLLPDEMITSSIDSMNSQLGDQENKRRLEDDKDELYSIIDSTLSPYFQKQYAGRLVLNKHWTKTDTDQRARFTEGLYQSLVKSYALTLLNFDVSNIKVLPIVEITDQTKKLTVKSEVLYKGEVIPMNFSFGLFRDGWRFFDVRIEGVSYIKNYRNQFDAEITAVGIDAVIERLESED
ncbi:MAG: ABC transporter substrate-binding protein [Gammaproteobacteria bacterium]|jgi:phospholipid transport system substrate-binding protein|nr:ABC transporter substrate-binding protein [Gammaproteobacteria bacterium]|tara:strand:+ start:2119 stop:2718 length:600 start_codon:yes stop_codon:yes gene_type:complete